MADEPMSGKHEQFISEEDEELRRIREKKLGQLMEPREKRQKMSAKLIQVTDSNFNEIVSRHSLALIDCWAPWCGPCLALAPAIEELAEEYAGKAIFGKLNVDENPSTAECFQIFSIPTTLIMKNGREVERIVGLVPKRHIEAALEKHLG
jgi:thioredoxin 1